MVAKISSFINLPSNPKAIVASLRVNLSSSLFPKATEARPRLLMSPQSVALKSVRRTVALAAAVGGLETIGGTEAAVVITAGI